MNQTMPNKKEDFSAALNKPTPPELGNTVPATMIDDYLRDVSPTGVIAPNNFSSTIGPSSGNGPSAAVNHRDIMNKTVNL
jgi:hypothetical protein